MKGQKYGHRHEDWNSDLGINASEWWIDYMLALPALGFIFGWKQTGNDNKHLPEVIWWFFSKTCKIH